MHEFEIARSLMDVIAEQMREHTATKARKAWISLGAACGISPASLKEIFPTASDGTDFEGMELDAMIVPVTCLCRRCKNNIELREYTDPLVCGNCGSGDVECPEEGQVIYLTKLELEVYGRVESFDLKGIMVRREPLH